MIQVARRRWKTPYGILPSIDDAADCGMWKKYLTIKEAAELLGVTPLTLRNWDRRGQLRAHRHPVNNYRLYRLADLETFMHRVDASKPRTLKIRVEE